MISIKAKVSLIPTHPSPSIKPTRLISIESQPKKIDVVVVVVIDVIIVVHIVVVVIPVVDPRNLLLKLG